MKTNDAFILPNKWFIRINDNNRDIVNSWKILQRHYNENLFSNLRWNIVRESGAGAMFNNDGFNKEMLERTEITTEQFQKYILGIEIQEEKEIINENYDYLIAIFKKLNIK